MLYKSLILQSRLTSQFQRLFSQAASCLPAQPQVRLDDECPPKQTCSKRSYQQQWIECPQPVVVEHPRTAGVIPFVKRASKPDTASKCAALKNCEGCVQRQRCKFRESKECDRVSPPCRAFSELLDFKQLPDGTECLRGEGLPPLRFGFKKPCCEI